MISKSAWEEIQYIYTLPTASPIGISKFQDLQNNQTTYTRAEGNLDHYCAFFLPFDRQVGKIYLGDHIKAEGWIPPGGHIEPGETPTDAVLREMKEELQVDITKDQVRSFDLSVTLVNRVKQGCMAHYDVWHTVDIAEQSFDFDKREYHDAGWFTLEEGVKKMAKYPQFAAIVAKLA